MGGYTLTTNSAPTTYSQALFVAKYDNNNNIEWVKKIAEGNYLYEFSLTSNKDNHFAIAIYYEDYMLLGSDTFQSNGDTDILLASFDSNFNQNGAINIGGINTEWNNLTSLIKGEEGFFYLTGIFNYTFSGSYPNYKMVIGNDTLKADNQDIFVAKFDSLCNPIWAKSYKSPSQSDGSIGLVYHDNALYLSGGTGATFNNKIGGLTFDFPINYTVKLFVAKLDTLGNAIWVRKFGNEDQFASMGANALAVQGNRVYVGGSGFTNLSNTFHFEGGPTLNGNGASTEYYIASYDTAGNFKWNTIAKNFNEATIASMACDNASNVYVTGKFDTKLQFPNDTLITHGAQDAFVLSYDSSGNYRWAINGGGIAAERGDDIALDHNGKPWIVGGTTSAECSFGNDLIQNPWSNALFMASIDSIGYAVGVHTFKKNELGLQLYPNPVHDELVIEVNGEQVSATVYLYNMTANILSKYHVKDKRLIINTSSLPSGLYLIRYVSDHYDVARKVLIEH